MPFNSTNLSALSYTNGFTLWHYRSSDHISDGDQYFNPAYHLLRIGDFIFCNMGVKTEAPSHYTLVVVDINPETKTVHIESLNGIKLQKPQEAIVDLFEEVVGNA